MSADQNGVIRLSALPQYQGASYQSITPWNTGYNSTPTFDWSKFYSAPSVAASYTPSPVVPDKDKQEKQDRLLRAIVDQAAKPAPKEKTVEQKINSDLDNINKKAENEKKNHVGFWRGLAKVGLGFLKALPEAFGNIDDKGFHFSLSKTVKTVGLTAAAIGLGMLCPPLVPVMAVAFGGMAVIDGAKKLEVMTSDTATKQQKEDACDGFGKDLFAVVGAAAGVKSGCALASRYSALRESRAVIQEVEARSSSKAIDSIALEDAKTLQSAARSKGIAPKDIAEARQELQATRQRATRANEETGASSSSASREAFADELIPLLKRLQNSKNKNLPEDVQTQAGKMVKQLGKEGDGYSVSKLNSEVDSLLAKLDKSHPQEARAINAIMNKVTNKPSLLSRLTKTVKNSKGKADKKQTPNDGEQRPGIWTRTRDGIKTKGRAVAGRVEDLKDTYYSDGKLTRKALGYTFAAGTQTITPLSEFVGESFAPAVSAQTKADKEQKLTEALQAAETLKIDSAKIEEIKNNTLPIDEKIKALTKEIAEIRKPYKDLYVRVLKGDENDIANMSEEDIRTAIINKLSPSLVYLHDQGILTDEMQRDIFKNPSIVSSILETEKTARKDADDKAKAEAKRQQDAMNQRMAQFQNYGSNPFAYPMPAFS